MTVNPLTGLFSGASNQLQRTASRVQSTIESLLTGKTSVSAGGDVSSIAIAAQLQSRIGAIRSIAGGIAQSLSISEVASQGVGREIEIVNRLKQLAAQSNNGSLNQDNRKALDTEFQGLVQELNHISSSTQFGGQNLLDGSFTLSIDQSLTQEGDETPQLKIADLSAPALFGGKSLSLLTQASAAQAIDALASAANTLTQARSDIGSFSGALGYASANLESALFNQEAARSELTDSDFTGDSSILAQLNFQNNSQIALAAQGNRLQSTILQLLNY